jgi:hypothetical protein
MNRSLPLLAALSLASCEPYLSLTTPAPPSATLLLDSKADEIHLSQGVAGAFVAYCSPWAEMTTCDRASLEASTDAPAVAEVRRAHLGSLDSTNGVTANTPVFAVVGVAQGHATVRVTDGFHARNYSVTVLPR